MFPVPKFRSAVLISVWLIWLGRPLVPVCAQTPHIHILLIADTNDSSIGEGVQATVWQIKSAFAGRVPADRYSLRVLESKTVDYCSFAY